ncbi:NAD(P)-dependent oxidoreductase [Streptomyces sp. B1-3]|uniref:NAD(P)-dependent oxidoreductase n=1 Tax=Streptomyces sp. B1-3 TaxID=3141453 RepID=UPI003D26BA46
MKIAVYGATGMIGSRVVAEALARGHEVTGITRSGGSLPEGVMALRGNAGNADLAKTVAANADVVVSAIGPNFGSNRESGNLREFIDHTRNLADASGGTPLIVVGGAGSLVVDGVRLVDMPGVPDTHKPWMLIVAEALDMLRAQPEGVEWTFLSPPPVIQPGARTGSYRLGGGSPAGDAISAEDYAVALIDEAERPAHRRRRFTVAN